MIRVIRIILEYKWVFIDNGMTFLADIFPQAPGLFTVMAWAAKMPPSILYKSNVCKNLLAEVTAETFWMPTIVHGFNHSANNELTTLMTTGCKKHLKIMFAVFSPFKLIEQAFWELLEALSTYKTLLMIQLSVAVHNPLRWFKATFASLAHGISQSICHVASGHSSNGEHSPCVSG